jgi:hypothetical protein
VIMTNGLGTLCRQRMIVMMFMGMDVTPDIVRRNAHKTGNSFYHIKPWVSIICLMLTTHARERVSVAQYDVETRL